MVPPEENSSHPKFSVITPTYQREAHLIRQYDGFKAQDYPNKEWLILDDSPKPSPFFSALDDPEVYYFYSPERITIGEKRNILIEEAIGEYIAHFDDDDYYAPHYLTTMAKHLETLDFVKLSAWFVYSEAHDFWGYFDGNFDTCRPPTSHYYLKANGPIQLIENFQPDITMRWGYGFSYAYQRGVWEAFPFEPLNFGEDHTLVLERLLPGGIRMEHVPDTEGLVLHILHQTNASEAFPQYRLPKAFIPRELLLFVEHTLTPACLLRDQSLSLDQSLSKIQQKLPKIA